MATTTTTPPSQSRPASPSSSDADMDDSVSSQTAANYQFPTHRYKRQQTQANRIPLVFVACGSFSPITYLHLRMFEMAADFAKFNTEFEVLGGFLSPVSDAYKKAGLTSARHRLRMCELAVQQTSNWLMVDPWEALQEKYTPTALVLDHFEHEINVVQGGVLDDLEHILGRYGTFIVERTGTDIDDALSSLQAWKEKIWVIPQLILNDVSSTKIRLFLRREMSVRYLIPAQVIQYIEENGLYEEEGAEGKGKGKTTTTGKVLYWERGSLHAKRKVLLLGKGI
ncbi:hypothetical protein VE04_00231 [Pseudogymnoascus sp. 24MN13]|nr:hypothetical protein VE04_00231 [Pseudogymnoascus sp. 24MN13]